MNSEQIRIGQALAEGRYETARRLCRDYLAHEPANPAVGRQLYRAYRALGDYRNARVILERNRPETDAERLEFLLLEAEDYHRLSGYDFYRDSEEAKAGLSSDEYQEKMAGLADTRFAAAEEQVTEASDARAVVEVLRRTRRYEWARRVEDRYPSTSAPPETGSGNREHERATGVLSGRLRFPDGTPVAFAVLKLGLETQVEIVPPGDVFYPHLHPRPVIGEPRVVTTQTDAEGQFRFEAIPVGRHEFLAATLDPDSFDICTHFVAHDPEVLAVPGPLLDLTLAEWHSAPARVVANPFKAELERGGVRYVLRYREVWKNPFYFDFPRQVVQFNLREGSAWEETQWLLLDSRDLETPLIFQPVEGGVVFLTDLPAQADCVIALYEAVERASIAEQGRGVLAPFVEPGGATAIIDTGRARFRIPWGGSEAPPILAVQGEDGLWRGEGRFRGPVAEQIQGWWTEVLEQGPVQLRVEVGYELEGGKSWRFVLTAHRDEPYLLVHEIAPDVEGSFQFSLRDISQAPAGGRAFLHWKSETGGVHWTSLAAEEREVARLQEQTPWWIAPQGFACAITPDNTREQDYIAVFSRRRGEWIDRAFERLANGPVDAEGQEDRELDWPYPEMMGSTISMITAQTDATGDACFRFRAFDGERHWGLLVSTLDRNDGPYKELSAVQHKTSSPRLQDFKDWRLDEADRQARPMVVAKRDELRLLRARRHSPVFGPVWDKMVSLSRPGPVEGLRFAVEGDPLIAWKKKQELVAEAHLRARMTLLGRDYSDMYSPVGARPITHWAEEYDLIAASGVFTPDEERLVRAFLMLMGHMYMERDFMNWNFNSRNANFEADRMDVVGAIGLCFMGNPDAKQFIQHAALRLEKSLRVYCTPGSGKWYENPACYYLQASKCYMNLLFHLARHGVCDPARIPRLKEFLRWGILLLTPPTPPRYEDMRDGLGEAEYGQTEKVRRISPIGDHALIGPWVPEHYALMSRLFRASDPDFADLLIWAYREGGSDGGYFGNLPLLFSALDEEDLEVSPGYDPSPLFQSRRLEGFGAAFRGSFGRENEFFLLFKQGPGGYRYHRTEGSFLLFAHGRPLVYDGGEAGETWRHSTLSFHETHMPLAPGWVERFHSDAAVDFVQGVHPVLLNPGTPVFLSDNCRHELVQEAYARRAVTSPPVVRSLFWVKDEYVIVHDELAIPAAVKSHWHLQVVADGHSESVDEGYRFTGRFGTDLQVLLPDQALASATISQVPILEYHKPTEESFSMRHLEVRAEAADHYLAVLRPLYADKAEVQATTIRGAQGTVGVRVQNGAMDDTIFFRRDGMVHNSVAVCFEGRYGAVLRRPGVTTYLLLDGNQIQADGISVRGNGRPVRLEIRADSARLFAERPEEVHIEGTIPRLEIVH